MASKLRASQRPSPLNVGPNRSRGQFPISNPGKKVILRPIPPKQSSSSSSSNNENDTEKQPISDYPSPPVQIVSCRHGQPGEMIPLASLATAPHGEIPQLTIQKLKQCQQICDFSDANSDLGSKATKKAALNELIDCYSNPKLFSRLSRECHQQVIETFAANVFRPPPNIPRALMVSDEVTIEDTAWPHLQLVYLLFLKFLECNVELRILQYQLQPKFISNIFAVLDFPDERERIQARTVIATIYTKVPPQRTLLMNITLNLLMSVPEDLEMNAALHLLELFYQFTSNTPPPLSQQLVQAFEKVLLPLHLPHRCQRYFHSLVRCILLMTKKDARLANNLLQFLISHWPLTLDHKSELFIDEVTQMLDETTPQDLSKNITALLSCVSIAAESPCMTLADKALKFMLNNRVQNLIVENPDNLLKIIFPPLFRVACGHWQRSLQLNALNVMNTLMELSPAAFKRAAEAFKASAMMEGARKAQKKGLWDAVAQAATTNDETIDTESITVELTAFYGANRAMPARNGSQPAMNIWKGSQPTLNVRMKNDTDKMLSRSTPSKMLMSSNSNPNNNVYNNNNSNSNGNFNGINNNENLGNKTISFDNTNNNNANANGDYNQNFPKYENNSSINGYNYSSNNSSNNEICCVKEDAITEEDTAGENTNNENVITEEINEDNAIAEEENEGINEEENNAIKEEEENEILNEEENDVINEGENDVINEEENETLNEEENDTIKEEENDVINEEENDTMNEDNAIEKDTNENGKEETFEEETRTTTTITEVEEDSFPAEPIGFSATTTIVEEAEDTFE